MSADVPLFFLRLNSSICSGAAGKGICLPQACKDAPLGQRQGGVFRVPPPYLWTPPTPQRNNCDRRQRRKQGAVVGAAASKTRVPPKARSGCWVPQPVRRGDLFKIVFLRAATFHNIKLQPICNLVLQLGSISCIIFPARKCKLIANC